MKKIMIVIALIFVFGGIVYADLNDGLIAYYPFNSNANDESGNGYHGTVHGASLTTDRFNNSNSAYFFDGQDDKISIDEVEAFRLNSWSISGWIYVNSFADIAVKIIGKDEVESRYNYRVVIMDKSVVSRYENCESEDDHFLYSNIIEEGEWIFFTATKDNQSGNYQIFINGEKENSTIVKDQPCMNEGTFSIGSDAGQTKNFHGIADDFRIYNRALSESEIKELFNVGDNNCLQELQKLADKYESLNMVNETLIDEFDKLSNEYNLLTNTYLLLTSNYRALSSSYIETNENNELLTSTNEKLKEQISSMYTQEDMNKTISQKDRIISQLNSMMASMYSQTELDTAIIEARKGLYTSENVELMINKVLEWDIDNDGKIGLVEAIQALMRSTGIKPIE